MSYSTPDLVLSDVNVERFYDRNDLHIYINDKLFFGEGIHPSSHITAYYAAQAFEQVPMSLGGICAPVWTLLSLSPSVTMASFNRNNLPPTSRSPWIYNPDKRLETVKLTIS
jgi:hypothetical protein